MARYFFDVKDGDWLVDPDGLDCTDDTRAMDHAGVIARRIGLQSPTGNRRKVAVIDNHGHEIGSVAKLSVKCD